MPPRAAPAGSPPVWPQSVSALSSAAAAAFVLPAVPAWLFVSVSYNPWWSAGSSCGGAVVVAVAVVVAALVHLHQISAFSEAGACSRSSRVSGVTELETPDTDS